MPDDPNEHSGGLWSRVSQILPGLGHALAKAAPYVQAVAPSIQSIGESLTAAGGTPLQQQSLQATRQNRLQSQGLSDRRLLLASQLSSADLGRQLRQKELDNYQTPAPKVFPGTNEAGQQGYYQQQFDPESKSWDIKPATTSRQTVVSSPDNPKIPFDPTQTISRTTR